MGDRRTGTARTDQEYGVHRNVRQATPQALRETPEIGIVAEAFAVAENDRVDCTNAPCGIRQLMQVGNDRLFEGEGHVQSDKPGPLA